MLTFKICFKKMQSVSICRVFHRCHTLYSNSISMLQLNWCSISKSVIVFLQVRFYSRYVMLHIVVIRIKSRLRDIYIPEFQISNYKVPDFTSVNMYGWNKVNMICTSILRSRVVDGSRRIWGVCWKRHDVLGSPLTLI